MKRTIVYIDGFNLYYRALKPLGHRWMNIAALAAAVLPDSNQITAINYYTARVSGRVDQAAPARQHAYFRALESLPLVDIHYGNFLTMEKWSGLVHPPQFRPEFTLPPGASPHVAYVWKTEEKGSDVNLGVHLVRDAFTHAFDEAAVLTNELIWPSQSASPRGKRAARDAADAGFQTVNVSCGVSSHVRHIQPYLGPCVFPDPVVLANGRTVAKPAGW